jgi:hypothetical protein
MRVQDTGWTIEAYAEGPDEISLVVGHFSSSLATGLPLAVIRALLAEHGLHIVSEADMAVFRAAEDLDTGDIDAIRNLHTDLGDALLDLMRQRLVASRAGQKSGGT